jgi:hypothetical protein
VERGEVPGRRTTRAGPMPEHAPNRRPVPVGLTDWFADGASALESLFRRSGPGVTKPLVTSSNPNT